MIIEFAAVAIGVAVAVVLVWRKIAQIQRRVRGLDIQLAKMQKEIDVLQMQESRRLMVELRTNSANFRAEASQLHPDHGSADIGGDEVMRLMKTPPTTPA